MSIKEQALAPRQQRSFALRSVDRVDRGRWDAFVSASPHGSVFCHSWFLDALGVDYELWCAETNGGEPYLGAVVLKDDGGLPFRAPFPFSLYQGLLFSAGHEALPTHTRVSSGLRCVEFLLGELEKRYGRISFCLHPDFEDARGLSWLHYHEPERGRFDMQVHYSGRIELPQEIEEYVQSVRRTRRYEYRRARTRLTLELSNDVDTLLALNQLTFARQGISIDGAVQGRLRSIATASLSKGSGEIIIARTPDGRAASAALFLYDARAGYYLVGANDPEFRDSGSGTFVVIEGLQRCLARGLRSVDVCGMNSPNRADFKSSLNALPVPYFVATWERPDELPG